jgi:hypothetical protein
MSHNDPLNPPTEEQRIDWFLDSVTERTYDAVQATCSEGNIDGTLTFNKMVKLFTHKCFQRYPEFQIKELVATSSNTTVTNNSTSTYDKRGRNNRDKGKGRGKGSSSRGPKGNRNPPGQGQGKGGKGKPKGKGKPRPPMGNRNSETCSYCGKPGHENRECRKRQWDEKQAKKPTHSNNSQHATHLQVDETTVMFTHHAIFAEPLDDHNIATGNDQENIAPEAQDTDSESQEEPTPEFTLAPTGTFLRFYSTEPSYLQPRETVDSYCHPTLVTPSAEPETAELPPLEALPPGSPTNLPDELEGSSSVSDSAPELPNPQRGQYRQEITPLSMWTAASRSPTQPNYLFRSCSVCDKSMVTLNPFKTLTCHDCLRWI